VDHEGALAVGVRESREAVLADARGELHFLSQLLGSGRWLGRPVGQEGLAGLVRSLEPRVVGREVAAGPGSDPEPAASPVWPGCWVGEILDAVGTRAVRLGEQFGHPVEGRLPG